MTIKQLSLVRKLIIGLFIYLACVFFYVANACPTWRQAGDIAFRVAEPISIAAPEPVCRYRWILIAGRWVYVCV